MKINNGPVRENEKVVRNIEKVEVKTNKTVDVDDNANALPNRTEVSRFVDTILSKDYKSEMNSRNARLPTTESEDRTIRNLELKERISKLEEIKVEKEEVKVAVEVEQEEEYVDNFVEDNFNVNEDNNKEEEEREKTEEKIQNLSKNKLKTIEEEPHQSLEPNKEREKEIIESKKEIIKVEEEKTSQPEIRPTSIPNKEISPKNKISEQFTNSSAESLSKKSKNNPQTLLSSDTIEHQSDKVEDEKEDVLEQYIKKLEESLNENMRNNEEYEDYSKNKQVKNNLPQTKASINTNKKEKEKANITAKPPLKIITKEQPKEEVKTNKMFIKKITITDKFNKEHVELTKKKSEETKNEPPSPTKSKIGFLKSQRSEDKSPIKAAVISSPVKVFDNNSGFLYKKENQLSKEKFKKEIQANLPNNLHVQNMAKTQLKDFKNKKVKLFINELLDYENKK